MGEFPQCPSLSAVGSRKKKGIIHLASVVCVMLLLFLKRKLDKKVKETKSTYSNQHLQMSRASTEVLCRERGKQFLKGTNMALNPRQSWTSFLIPAQHFSLLSAFLHHNFTKQHCSFMILYHYIPICQDDRLPFHGMNLEIGNLSKTRHVRKLRGPIQVRTQWHFLTPNY